MAMGRWVITAPVTVPAGTATAVAGGLGTVSWAGAGAPAVWLDGMPASGPTFVPGQVIMFDPATTADLALQSAIGAGNLRPYVQGQDDQGGAALSN
jgi:hypothetical protein